MALAVPDVNVLLALIHPRHVHSSHAFRWLGEQSGDKSIGVCRSVQKGVLRLLTTPSVMGPELLAPRDAFIGFNHLMQDSRFVFLEESRSLDRFWERIIRNLPARTQIDTDTYLAAFALANGGTIVTFDRGFKRFHGLSVITLG